MGMFVISTRAKGDYKFTFTSRKGKTIFTSISHKEKIDCEAMIAAIREDITRFTITKNTTASGKHFFRITKDGLVLATSRKYTTPLLLQKGIDELTRSLRTAEVLDFSDGAFVFPDAGEIFGDA